MRGIQDYGRVNVLVDGARQNFQREGHSAKGTFYFDPEMMKSVDVTRGPVSSVYGSGAIGGVVSFTTIDAGDILQNGQAFGGRLKGRFRDERPTPLLHGEVGGRPCETPSISSAPPPGAERVTIGRETGRMIDHTAQDLRLRPVQDADPAGFRPGGDAFRPADRERLRQRPDDDLPDQAIADTFTAGYRWTPDSPAWDLSAKTYYSRHERQADDLTGYRHRRPRRPSTSARSASISSTPRGSRRVPSGTN